MSPPKESEPAREPEPKPKLSHEFVNRLNHLNPDQPVRAIVVLNTSGARNPAPGAQRQSCEQRQAAISSMSSASQQAWRAIAPIVERFGGHPLAKTPNVLGAIPVEISAAGVQALAESDSVNAILEDQTIYPFRR